MNMLLKAYHSLLADITKLSGVHLDPPDTITMQWLLVEAPKLDKALLVFMECAPCMLHSHEVLSQCTHPDSDFLVGPPELPEWLKPLWSAYTHKLDIRFIGYLRQVLVFCYKVEFEPTNEQQEAAEMQFLETEETVGIWNSWFKTKHYDPMFHTARSIFNKVIYRVDWQNIVPSHGPGAVYPPCLPQEKSNFCTLYSNIEKFYASDIYFGMPGLQDPSTLKDYLSKHSSYAVSEDIIAALYSVPKDSRGPRLICVHPKESIWIQQGQRRQFENAISSDPVVSKSIALNDQTVNGRKALDASVDRSYTTIDLKEASDRIGSALIEYLLGASYDVVSCARATHVKVGKRVHKLEKWAPMGNCLTFPMQSLVFYSLVRAGIRVSYGIDCTDIYVFGDDIIVPSKYYAGALRGLLPAGLVPNVSKTFRHGFFRESCGVDAFHGVDITPHRLKKHDSSTYSGAVSLCTLAKNMRMDGFQFCSSFLYSEVAKRYGTLHLCNNPDTQGIFEYVSTVSEVFRYEPSLRFNKRLQRWEVRCLLVENTLGVLEKHDWYHVQDSLLRLARLGKTYSDRGTEYSVPYRERLHYGWTPLGYPNG